MINIQKMKTGVLADLNKSRKSTGSRESNNRSWRRKVRELDQSDNCIFDVCLTPINSPDATRPLLIIVHPGDAIEDGAGYNAFDREAVIAFGLKNTNGMASEIMELLPVSDVVILHRASTVYAMLDAPQETPYKPYLTACNLASKSGAVLYGDDLKLASNWIIEHMEVRTRPNIFMAGAYASADHGCITFIGEQLQLTGCGPITVSDHAPTDNANVSPRWVPSVMSLDKKPLIRNLKPKI